jgi:hypothetical protein
LRGFRDPAWRQVLKTFCVGLHQSFDTPWNWRRIDRVSRSTAGISDAADTSLRLLDELFEDHRLIELPVPRAIQKRHTPMCGTLSQCIQLGCALAELDAVALTKFGPTFWVVAEPFSQLGARCEFSCPIIQRSVSLLNATRPDPIHEYAATIGSCRFVVDTLDVNIAFDGRRRLQLMDEAGGRAVRTGRGRDPVFAWCGHLDAPRSLQ